MDRLCGWKKNQKLLFIWELLTKTYERPTTQFKRATYLVIYLFNRMTARRNNANEGVKARAQSLADQTPPKCANSQTDHARRLTVFLSLEKLKVEWDAERFKTKSPPVLNVTNQFLPGWAAAVRVDIFHSPRPQRSLRREKKRN